MNVTLPSPESSTPQNQLEGLGSVVCSSMRPGNAAKHISLLLNSEKDVI